jgi:ADP-ribosylglycohydrolase
MTRTERVRGGLYGLLVGDALGVPYEFHDPANLPDRDDIDMVPPPGFNRSHRGTPVGTWSDDGAQALALLDTLVACGGFDPVHYGKNLVAWWNEGAFTPDGRAFDIGNQTTVALERLEGGTPPLQAGGSGERDNGNGSLMRVLPLALWHEGSDAELVRDAHLQSRVTHAHPRSMVCCALYCLWARRILEGGADPYDAAIDALQALYAEAPAHRAELERVQQPFVPRGTGYVLDCLHSARVALRGPDYASVVRRAVAFGLDTDTTAAVAGGIAGLRWGEQGIPAGWREGLQGRALVESYCSALGWSESGGG